MMTPKKAAFETAAATLIQNLEKRGMDGYYFEDCASCVQAILNALPENSVISFGGSESVKESGLMDALMNGPYTMIDRFFAKTPEESRTLYAKSVMADFFLMSTNAITLDGELVNIDGRGNRLACLLHGPEQVIIIAGMNKLVSNVTSAIDRVRNFAAPPNAKRLERQTPCHMTGRCGDCLSPDCMCSNIVITRKGTTNNDGRKRLQVYLIAEDLGY